MYEVLRNMLYDINFHLLKYCHENTTKSEKFTKRVFGKRNASKFHRQRPQQISSSALIHLYIIQCFCFPLKKILWCLYPHGCKQELDIYSKNSGCIFFFSLNTNLYCFYDFIRPRKEVIKKISLFLKKNVSKTNRVNETVTFAWSTKYNAHDSW